MKRKKRIALLTGGGDCPGLNAVIRAVTKKAILDYDMEVIGVEDGYYGVINNRYRNLSFNDVSGILTFGGTILGTSNSANPYRYAIKKGDDIEFTDVSQKTVENIKKLDIDCLVCIGGDGSLGISHKMFKDGIPVVGVPKTIDNDLRGTDITFGFDSAVQIAADGIDRIHSTAQSHHRVMIIEVMGRNAGWIALHSGIAGGGDIILIPEIPYNLDKITQRVKERSQEGKRFSIIVIAEGAKPEGGEVVVKRLAKESDVAARLGGVSFVLGAQIENATGLETRAVVMGHLLRGGSPSSFDRVLATKLGAAAVDMIVNSRFGYMVGVKGGSLTEVPLEEVARGIRTVSIDDPLIEAGRSVGTCFGD